MSAKFVAIVVDQWCGGDASAEVRELIATTIETAREEAERFIDEQGGTSALFVIQARCAGDGGVELAWEELDPGVILRKQDDARREREAKARAEAREAKLFQLRGEIAVLERLAAVQDDAACSEYARRELAGRRAVLAKLEAE